MPATPRARLVDKELPMHYHLISRCVRLAWLCGNDKRGRKKYDHRKDWLVERLFHLAKCFAVEIDGFAIMSNHFHLVVYYDPLACYSWDDAEVARRWTQAFPPRVSPDRPQELEALQEIEREALMQDAVQLERRRLSLGNLSSFMQHLKQPIAWKANREDKCTGHFFEKRFYSGALLDEKAVLASMAYVDLNPVRARICEDIEGYENTSIYRRMAHLANSPEKLHEVLQPLVSGLGSRSTSLWVNLADYIHHLRILSASSEEPVTDEQAAWFNQVASIRKRQRAYGLIDELKTWVLRQGWRRTGDALV